MSTQPGRVPFGVLTLDYPMSIGVFATYSEAQRAVDSLSDMDGMLKCFTEDAVLDLSSVIPKDPVAMRRG